MLSESAIIATRKEYTENMTAKLITQIRIKKKRKRGIISLLFHLEK